MSKAVQIRGVPDDVHQELVRRAAEAGLSLSQYLLGEVIRVASRPSLVDVLRRSDAHRTGTGGPEILDAVREARHRAGN